LKEFGGGRTVIADIGVLILRRCALCRCTSDHKRQDCEQATPDQRPGAISARAAVPANSARAIMTAAPFLGPPAAATILILVPWSGSLSRIDPAAQTIVTMVVDNMQAETGAPPIAARGEEGIEGLGAGHQGSCRSRCRRKEISTFSSRTACTLTLTVPFRHRNAWVTELRKKIGEYCPVWTWIAVSSSDPVGSRRGGGHALLFETRPQAPDHFFGEVTQIEDPLIGVVPVDRYLLERPRSFRRPD